MTTQYLQFGAIVVVVALTVASLPAGALNTTTPFQPQQDGLPEVTFDDQTSDGTSVTVANASNETGPFYAAVWTLDDAGAPETLLGFIQVVGTSASNVSVELTEASITENQTLVAAVHPDQDSDASTVDPDTETILASDTASLTVETTVTGESFTVSDLAAPSPLSPDVPTVVTATVSNPNDAPDTQSVEYRFDGAVQVRQQISLGPGESTTATFAVDPSEFEPGEYIHGVYTRESSASSTISIGPPSFEVVDVQPQDNPVVGEKLDVTANLSNPGTIGDTQPVQLWLDGELVDEQEVTVGPGVNQTVELAAVDTADISPGEHDIAVLTRDDGQFATITVESVPTDSTVTFQNQTSDGTNVTVDSVFLPNGGFVTIHDTSLLDGDAVGSVVGVSEHLDPGVSQNVEITLFNVSGATFTETQLTESQTLIAMPHLDTGNDQTYDFVTTNGQEDIPYVDAGGVPVTDSAEVTLEEPSAGATVTFDDQTSDGTSVTVANASNETGPFYAAVWTLDDAGAPETLLGFVQVNDTSASSVSVELATPVNESQPLVAAVHPDQDGDAGTTDPDTETILASDTANVTVEASTPTPTATPTSTPTEIPTSAPTETPSGTPTSEPSPEPSPSPSPTVTPGPVTTPGPA